MSYSHIARTAGMLAGLATAASTTFAAAYPSPAPVPSIPARDELLSLPGLSADQIKLHHGLYEGYVKKTNEIGGKLAEASREGANATFADIRELKVELSFALNGVKLHEAYFGNLTSRQTKPSAELTALIEASFGSADNWKADLAATGMAARGWAVTAYDYKDGLLHNYFADAHNQYGIWDAVPILVLDVYEHAYLYDYKTDRKSYIEAFTKLVDWEAASSRLSQARQRK